MSTQQRRMHGQALPLDQLRQRPETLILTRGSQNVTRALAGAIVNSTIDTLLTPFDYLFGDLQNQSDLQDTNEGHNHFLVSGAQTVANLKQLGLAMISTDSDDTAPDASIPAVYTYLGQFIDHDITFDAESSNLGALDDDLPLTKDTVLTKIMNVRTPSLDLDSVYGQYRRPDGNGGFVLVPVPRDENEPNKFALSTVSPPTFSRPEGIPDGMDFDLPREGRNDTVRALDRTAMIADERNDENLIIAQLHLAFLKAHNALVAQGLDFDEARRVLTQLYQWVVLHDFLPKVTDPDILTKVESGNLIFKPDDEEIYMPLEFSVAAYRFGHTMIRATYNHNSVFRAAPLIQLFGFTAFSGEITVPPGRTGALTLPEDWIIDWSRLLDMDLNRARALDTQLVNPLSLLPNIQGIEQTDPLKGNLAVRNLLRGYKLRMPTGQTIAREISQIVGEDPQTFILSADEILSTQAAQKAGVEFIESAQFDTRTPFWFYILAESEIKGNAQHLGPVGSYLVAEVLYELVRQEPVYSILKSEGWTPARLVTEFGEQFSAEQIEMFTQNFKLAELLKLAKVMASRYRRRVIRVRDAPGRRSYLPAKVSQNARS